MTVTLTPELEALVKRKVESGLFNSPAEVIHEALQLLNEQEELRRIRLERLRHEVQIGLDEADQRKAKPLDIEALKAQAKARFEAAQVA